METQINSSYDPSSSYNPCPTCTKFNGNICTLSGHRFFECTVENNYPHYCKNIKYCTATKQNEIYLSGHKCNACGKKH